MSGDAAGSGPRELVELPDCYTEPVTPKLYKAAEVCEMTGLQPYVLRSWEKEFPWIGIQRPQESSRVYRQSDVDQVVRIKQLVFGEGLTLAGARRRLEQSAPASSAARDEEMAEVLDSLGADARARIAAVRRGLRSLLDALSQRPGAVAIAPFGEVDSAAGSRRTGPTPRTHSGKASAHASDRRGAAARSSGRGASPKASVAAKRTSASKRAQPRKPGPPHRKRANA